MDAQNLKFLLMGVIFVSTTLVGVAPMLLRGACGQRFNAGVSAPTRARILSCASCFSAGVFMFVCFMGLLPAADSKFHLILKRLAEEDSSLEEFSEFPWGFFVVTCGFLVIFTIDKLVHALELGRRNKSDKSDTSSTPASDVTLLSIKGSPTALSTPLHLSDDPSLGQTDLKPSPTLQEYVTNSLKESQAHKENGPEQRYRTNGALPSTKMRGEKHVELHFQLQQDNPEKPLQPHQGKVLASEACVILERNEPSHGHGVPSSLIFLVALGIHSLFEGAAVGLQTEREKVLEFGVAVLVHELVMAFTFGLEVSRSRRLAWPWQVVYVMLFTGSIPLGIAIGAGLLRNTGSENREILAAVMEAIATGIFLHVIFIEIIAKEFPEHHPPHAPNPPKKPPIYHSIGGADTDEEAQAQLSSGSPLSQGPNEPSGHHDDYKGPSEVWLILEKILSICGGLLTLILLNVFMHSHGH